MPNAIVLGFDFGRKRIGVAVGQEVTKTARPLATILTCRGKPDWQKINAVIHNWQPSALIVGLPLNMDNSEQAITKSAKHFANQLQHRYQLPVHLVDERLSTIEARQLLFEQRGYRGIKKTEMDSIAAVLIIEDWLGRR